VAVANLPDMDKSQSGQRSSSTGSGRRSPSPLTRTRSSRVCSKRRAMHGRSSAAGSQSSAGTRSSSRSRPGSNASISYAGRRHQQLASSSPRPF
jgi:hypothetical protein